MTIGAEIESIRKQYGFSVAYVCNALNISSDFDYHSVIIGRYKLNIYQLILFIDATQMPLMELKPDYKD